MSAKTPSAKSTKRGFDPTKLTAAEAGNILDTIYKSALNGVPKVSQSVEQLAGDYMRKATSPRQAAVNLANWQVMKCGTSGFVTGLGGLMTLPVAVPANISSVMYVQMRMIAAIAYMGGYDIRSDQVQTMVYMCLTGTTATDIMKRAGIKAGEKGLEALIKKIPGAVVVKINQRMGFRFLTKFGEKGVINLGKMVPVVGGVIGGGVDIASTKVIAKSAITMFIETDNHDHGETRETETLEVIEYECESDLS